jgi:hypothetical protein
MNQTGKPPMVNLRYYETTKIEQTARDLSTQFSKGLIDRHQYGARRSQFVLRDQSGVYWAFDPSCDGWYIYSSEGWSPGSTPPASLEGPADLEIDDSLSAQEIQALIEQEERQLASPPVKQPAAQVLPELVEIINQAYLKGDISLEDELAMLVEHFLVDRLGQPWSVGVRSRSWYVFENTSWRQAATPPSEDEVLRPALRIEHCPACGREVSGEGSCPYCTAPLPQKRRLTGVEEVATLMSFLTFHLGELPEEAFEPWEPPAWYPDAVNVKGLTCPECQASNPAGSLYCNHCGALLETEEQESIPELPAAPDLPVAHSCPYCQAPINPGQKICSRCGKPLDLPR